LSPGRNARRPAMRFDVEAAGCTDNPLPAGGPVCAKGPQNDRLKPPQTAAKNCVDENVDGLRENQGALIGVGGGASIAAVMDTFSRSIGNSCERQGIPKAYQRNFYSDTQRPQTWWVAKTCKKKRKRHSGLFCGYSQDRSRCSLMGIELLAIAVAVCGERIVIESTRNHVAEPLDRHGHPADRNNHQRVALKGNVHSPGPRSRGSVRNKRDCRALQIVGG